MRRYARSRLTRCLAVAAGIGVLAACAVGPDYHRPKIDSTDAYKESGDWKPSEPNDVLSRGPWWEIFDDADLNLLETRIDISNENVKAAAAAFDQARALVSQARAGFWPSIAASVSRIHSGRGVPATANSGAAAPATASTRSTITNSAGVSANWDLDVWGQIRRTV